MIISTKAMESIRVLVIVQIIVLFYLFTHIVCSPLVDKKPTTTRINNRNHSTSSVQITTRENKSILEDDTQPQQGTTNDNKQTASKATKDTLATRRQGKNLKVDFREEVEDYPEDEINQILRRTPETLKDLYNVANTTLDSMATTFRSASFHYYDHEPGEETICRSRSQNIYPREALRHNSLVYIANNQEFKQVIQAEICEFPDRQCDKLQGGLPYGWESFCRQKYSYKKLLYLDTLEKRMASDLFPYPSCCSCHIRYSSDDFYLRSASSNGTQTSPKNATTIQDEGTEANEQRNHSNKLDLRSQNVNQTVVLQDDKIYIPHR